MALIVIVEEDFDLISEPFGLNRLMQQFA